jgi:hypothetical protein
MVLAACSTSPTASIAGFSPGRHRPRTGRVRSRSQDDVTLPPRVRTFSGRLRCPNPSDDKTASGSGLAVDGPPVRRCCTTPQAKTYGHPVPWSLFACCELWRLLVPWRCSPQAEKGKQCRSGSPPTEQAARVDLSLFPRRRVWSPDAPCSRRRRSDPVRM